MIQTALIQNAHNDLVTDACYDMYGLLLATCSLDQRIRVWSLDEGNGKWNLEDDWKAHDAALTKISWAHPSFGSIIASSSFDRTVKIWEQVHLDLELQANGSSSGTSSAGSTRWVERAVLMDAKGSVRAVEFAPHHFGLKLATISSDNHLRIYECLEAPALSSWTLADEVDVVSLPTILWRNHSLSQSLATSTPTPTQTGPGPLDGASVAGLLQAAHQQQQAQQMQTAAQHRPGVGTREADGGWYVSWCKERYWGEVLAAGCGVGGIVKIIQFSAHRRPLTLLTLEPPAPSRPSVNPPVGRSRSNPGPAPGAGSSYAAAAAGTGADDAPFAVTSVAWAPCCGRSFHLVATGSRDGRVRIWKVRPPPPPATQPAPGGGLGNARVGAGDEEEAMDVAMEGGEEKWNASLVAEFDDHKSSVGRVEWNITGTVLSSAGNDGRIRLWKQTVGGVWRTAGHISVEQAEELPQSAEVDMDENAVAD